MESSRTYAADKNVAEILERETGNFDLEWYTAFELYWELIRPEFEFSDRKESDLIAEVADWLTDQLS